MEIKDNSPELDLSSPEKLAEFMQTINTAKTKQDVKEGDNTDVKDIKKAQASSAEAEPEGDDEDDEQDGVLTIEQAQAQIRGLRKELARRSGNAEQVEALQGQINQLNTTIESLKETKTGDSVTDTIRKWTDNELDGKQIDWEDEMADARARYARAEETENSQEMKRQNERVQFAKRVLAGIRTEVKVRAEKAVQAKQEAAKRTDDVTTELQDMFEAVNTQFPDFQSPDSELWQAGNEEFNTHPELMRALGPAGELVAAAMAIVRNPELVKGKGNTAARKEVIQNITSGLKKGLLRGSAAPSTQRTVTPAVDTAEGLAAFNREIDRIKGGG